MGSSSIAPAVVAVLLTFLWLLSSVESSDDSCSPNADDSPACIFESKLDNKMYRFDLAAHIDGSPHGVRSEDGFYKVHIPGSSEQEATTYWFQLCEHMKFNHDPPMCHECETCGGPHHCGETCSALQSASYPGYSICTTLGYPKSTSYSLIEPQKPEHGVRVKMSTCNGLDANCSLSVLLYCNRKGVEDPTDVKNVSRCSFETAMKHPLGCPIVTTISRGGWGWFGTILIVLVCGFIVYMAIGIAYRVTVLGVSGFEAIPNLDFWQDLPSKIKKFLEYIYEQGMNLYQWFRQSSYTHINE